MFFFFNDTATTEIYTLSLHDALPISTRCATAVPHKWQHPRRELLPHFRDRKDAHNKRAHEGDRKSTRLNSSHANISYAVFCLKKKNTLPIPDNHNPFRSSQHTSALQS